MDDSELFERHIAPTLRRMYAEGKLKPSPIVERAQAWLALQDMKRAGVDLEACGFAEYAERLEAQRKIDWPEGWWLELEDGEATDRA